MGGDPSHLEHDHSDLEETHVARVNLTDALMALGFSKLESEVYLYLAQHPPATGYKIAKAIDRTNGNTYKALAALETKGAVIIERGDNRLCRAVPPSELLDQLERRFHVKKRYASLLLEGIEHAEEEDRIFQLNSVEEVYQRASEMLEASERFVLLDLFPVPFEVLERELQRTISRGVRVAVQVYDDIALPGAKVIVNRRVTPQQRQKSSQWLSLFADGQQYLMALLAEGGKVVHRANWSSSPMLAWAYCTYADSDFLLASLDYLLEKNAPIESLRDEVQNWKKLFPKSCATAYHGLAHRLGLN